MGRFGADAPVRVAVLAATTREQGTAALLVDWMTRILADEASLDLDVLRLAATDLPLEGVRAGGAPSPISDRLTNADGFCFVVPEYNHSFPAIVKNAIDWHYDEWRFKPATFVSYGSTSGGLRAIEQLRQVFPELYAVTTRNCVALPRPAEHLVDGRLELPDDVVEALRDTFHELAWWARILRRARAEDPYLPR